MGFATFDDKTGRLEVAAFSRTYEAYRDILSKDALLVAEGPLSIDDFSGGLRMTADKLYTFEQARELFARAIVLCWDRRESELETKSFVDTLRQTIQPFAGGSCPIQVQFSNTAKAVIQLGDDWRVHPTDELILRLNKFLSAENIEVIYGPPRIASKICS
jgi:DNA polymerase-3 subunit alpha